LVDAVHAVFEPLPNQSTSRRQTDSQLQVSDNAGYGDDSIRFDAGERLELAEARSIVKINAIAQANLEEEHVGVLRSLRAPAFLGTRNRRRTRMSGDPLAFWKRC
jgi:hypothetical protein